MFRYSQSFQNSRWTSYIHCWMFLIPFVNLSGGLPLGRILVSLQSMIFLVKLSSIVLAVCIAKLHFRGATFFSRHQRILFVVESIDQSLIFERNFRHTPFHGLCATSIYFRILLLTFPFPLISFFQIRILRTLRMPDLRFFSAFWLSSSNFSLWPGYIAPLCHRTCLS